MPDMAKKPKVTLREIKAPVAEELSSFEAHFKQSMQSKVALLDKICLLYTSPSPRDRG